MALLELKKRVKSPHNKRHSCVCYDFNEYLFLYFYLREFVLNFLLSPLSILLWFTYFCYGSMETKIRDT